MSAPVNVLRARLNRAFHSKEMSLGSYTEACELMQAIDRREVAVAELIEADREYDEARRDWLLSDWRTDAEKKLFEAASARRSAALARVTGAPS